MMVLKMKPVNVWAEEGKVAIANLQAYFDPGPLMEKVEAAAATATAAATAA